MPPPPAQPARPAHTFSALINGIIAHPLFALVIKKVFDVCGSNAVDRSLIRHFAETEGSATGLQQFAETHGLGNACERWTSTDVFMSAMVAALNQVNSRGTAGHVPLQHTILNGQKALCVVRTDPCFVGATEHPRVELSQQRDVVQRTDAADHLDRLKIDDPIHRSGPRQRVGGVQKPTHATRTSLSENAKVMLERWFQEHLKDPYPSREKKEELAVLCRVSFRCVNNWFGNKRMRIKRKMLKVNSESGDRISDKVLAPRSKWNAVVVSKLDSEAAREVVASATGRAVQLGANFEVEKDGHSMQVDRIGPCGSGRTERTQ